MVKIRNLIEGGKISGYQLGLLIIPTIIATGILFIPTVTAQAAGNSGWISVLVVATIPGLLVAEICIRLERRFPGQTFIHYSDAILGKYLGKLVGFSFLFYLIYINAIIINEFTSFIVGAFLTVTPPIAVTLAFMLVTASMVRNGLEVISRINEFTVVLFLLIFVVLIMLLVPDMEFKHLLPVFDKGIKGVILGALPPSGWRGEVVVIAMLLPFLNLPQRARKVTFTAVIAIGVLLAVDTIMTVAVFSDLAAYLTFPVLALAEYVSLSKVIERTEAVLMVIWVSGVMVKVAVFYYVAVLGTAQWFKLQDYKPLVLPIGMLLTVLSLIIFASGPELVKFLTTTFVPWAWFHELFIPLVLLIIAVLTGRRGLRE